MALLLTLSLLALVYGAPLNQNDPTPQPFLFNFTFTTPPPQNVTSPLVVVPTVVQQAPIDGTAQGSVVPSNGTIGTTIVPQVETTMINQSSSSSSILMDPLQSSSTSLPPPVILQGSFAPNALPPSTTPPVVQGSTSIFSTTMFSPILQDTVVSNQIVLQGSGMTNSVAPVVLPLQNGTIQATTMATDLNVSTSVGTGTPVFVIESSSPVVLRDAPVDLLAPVVSLNAQLTPSTMEASTQTSTTIPTVMNDQASPLINVIPVQSVPVQQTPVLTTQTPPPVNTAAGPLATPDQTNQQPQLDFVNSNPGFNAAYQYLNLTDSLAENFILNVSLPQSPINLLTRLQASTNQMNYTDKLDVALQLTALAHNLMSSVDDDLTLQEKH